MRVLAAAFIVLALFAAQAFPITNPYELHKTATVNVTDASKIIAAKVTSSSKDDIVSPYNNYTVIDPMRGEYIDRAAMDVYSFSSGALQRVGGYSDYQYNGMNTTLSKVTSLSAGKLRVAGTIRRESRDVQPFLADVIYENGALGQPAPASMQGMPAATFQNPATISTGVLMHDPAVCTGISMYEHNGSASGMRLHFMCPIGYATKFINYSYSGWVTDTGNFLSAFSGDEFAYAGQIVTNGQFAWELGLYSASSNMLLKVRNQTARTSDGKRAYFTGATHADLDSDGIDELILYGSFVPASGSVRDLIQIYKYGATGVLKNEYMDAFQKDGASFNSLGVADVDADGRLELVAVGSDSYSHGFSAYVFRYNATGTRLQKVYNETIAPASGSYGLVNAALGSFSAAGKPELAVAYADSTIGKKVISLYSFGPDTSPPVVSFAFPTGSTFYTNETLPVAINAVDDRAMNESSVKFTFVDGVQNLGTYLPKNGAAYSTSWALNYPQGNYVLRAEAKDASGNTGSVTKTITLLAPPPVQAPVDNVPPNVAVAMDSTQYQAGAIAQISAAVSDAGGAGSQISQDAIQITIRSSNGDNTGSAIAQETAPNSNIYVANMPMNLQPGNYVATANAVDNAGNVGQGSMQFSVAAAAVAPPAAPPVIPPAAPPAYQPANGSATANSTALPPANPPANGSQAANNAAAPPAPPAGNTGGVPPYSDQIAVSNLIAGLNAKIEVARQQGVSTTAAEIAVARATVLQNEGKYAAAALEAQQGNMQISAVLNRTAQPAPAAVDADEAKKAKQAVALLEAKIEIGIQKGSDMTVPMSSLIRSKALYAEGKYYEAALEAGFASKLADDETAKKLQPVSKQGFYMPCPVAPLLVGGLLLSMIAVGRRKKE